MASSANRSRALARATLVATFACLVLPVLLFGGDNTSEAWDQNEHHLDVIRQSAASLGGVADAPPLTSLLRDYPSATSPGYHLFLAACSTVGLGDLFVMRLISSLFGLALVVSVWRICCRSVDSWTACALTLPLVCSPYLLSGSIWLTTDVTAMWFIVLAVGSLLVAHPSSDDRMRSGVFAMLAVLVRQPSAWLVAPLFASGLLAGGEKWTLRGRCWWLFSLILPVAALLALVIAWGGLTPPRYQSMHNSGANWATPAVALAMLGVCGLPLVIAFGGATKTLRSVVGRWQLIAGAVGVLAAVLPATSFDREAGRWGGPIWSLISHAPTVADRSVLLLVLAPIGAIAGVAMMQRVVERGRVNAAKLLTVACAAMVAALTVNSQCFERYIDLPLLALMPIVIGLGAVSSNPNEQNRIRIACAILVLMQFALSLWMVFRPALLGVVDT